MRKTRQKQKKCTKFERLLMHSLFQNVFWEQRTKQYYKFKLSNTLVFSLYSIINNKNNISSGLYTNASKLIWGTIIGTSGSGVSKMMSWSGARDLDLLFYGWTDNSVADLDKDVVLMGTGRLGHLSVHLQKLHSESKG